MAENRMADVAKLFGKELGERFNVQDGKTNGLKNTFLCCFYTDRFESEIPGFKWSYKYNDVRLFSSLIRGEAEIVEDEK